MIRTFLICALAAACTRGARMDLTPGIAAESPAAAAREAGLADPPGLVEAAAPGRAGRFLVQPLQRLRRKRAGIRAPARIRSARGAAQRAGQLSRAAQRYRAQPGDAHLPRQLALVRAVRAVDEAQE